MYEFEYEFEGEAYPEFEYEFESEGEYESEEFFRSLAGLARRAIQSPTLRRAGLAAARSALGGLGNVGSAIGGVPGSRGARLGGTVGSALGSYLSGRLPQSEYEWEGEFEYEGEFEGEWEYEEELNPIRRVYPDALMEHLGHAAAQAESEAEAEAFIGAIVPLAARLLPQAGRTILRAAPGLIRGLAGATRTLRANPTTRPLVRTLPTAMRRTAAAIARQTATGRPIPPAAAVRTLARQTRQIVGSPQQAVRAFQRSRQLDRRYHQTQALPAPIGYPPAGLPLAGYPSDQPAPCECR